MNTSEDPEFKRAMAESLAELNKNASSEPEEEKKELVLLYQAKGMNIEEAKKLE